MSLAHVGSLPLSVLFQHCPLHLCGGWLLQSELSDSPLSCALASVKLPCTSKWYPGTPLYRLHGTYVFYFLLKQFSSKPEKHQEPEQDSSYGFSPINTTSSPASKRSNRLVRTVTDEIGTRELTTVVPSHYPFPLSQPCLQYQLI